MVVMRECLRIQLLVCRRRCWSWYRRMCASGGAVTFMTRIPSPRDRR